MEDTDRLKWPDVVVLMFSLIVGFFIRRMLWLCAGNAASIISATDSPRISNARCVYRSKLPYIAADLKCILALPFYTITIMLLSLPALAHFVWIISHPCKPLRTIAIVSHAAFTSAPPSKWLQFAGDCKLLVTRSIRHQQSPKCPKLS
jgi:hypothetical protein